MNKAEFIQRLTDQFRGMIAGAERRAQKEIEGSRGRMDSTGFAEYLKAERDAALSEPALQTYDHVLSASMGTPEDAAKTLAWLMAKSGVADWREQWQQAARITSGYKIEEAEDWRFRTAFVQFIDAIKAHTRARVFSQQIEQIMPAQEEQRHKKPTQVQYALYYKFLQTALVYPEFDGSNGKTKREMCIEIGDRHGISPDKFEQVYNRVQPNKAEVRDLEAVILMLSVDPTHLEAKRRAEDQLNVALAKNGKCNP